MTGHQALAVTLVACVVVLTSMRLLSHASTERFAHTGATRRTSATPRRRPPAAPGWWTRLRARPAANARAVADWCDEIGRELRAGVGIREAIAATDSAEPVLAAALHPMRTAAARGAPLEEALAVSVSTGRGAELASGPHLELAYVVLATVHRHGGAPALAIDRAAATLRQRAADSDERAVHAAQARMSGRVLTLLPVGMLVVLATTDGAVRASLLTPYGSLSVVAGLLLNIGGWCWINRLTRAHS